MNTTSSGSHHLATLSVSHSSNSSFDSSSPGFTTTHASGRSDHFGCGTPMTAASATLGCPMMAFSRSTDEIHSPPDLMTSLVRSTRRMYASGVTTAMSPVFSQPSSVNDSEARSSL